MTMHRAHNEHQLEIDRDIGRTNVRRQNNIKTPIQINKKSCCVAVVPKNSYSQKRERESKNQNV